MTGTKPGETRRRQFPLGAAVTLEQLADDPYEVMAELRAAEPVSWLPALDGWFVTRRDLGVEAMRDAATFTVEDDRFTTAAVLGPSMLSLDGPEHERHRSPFASAFRPRIVRDQFEGRLTAEARHLVGTTLATGRGELRSGLAGPLAVTAIAEFLGLADVTTEEILSWYTDISKAIVDLTTGESISASGTNAVHELRRRVDATVRAGESTALLRSIAAQGELAPNELASATAVVMFGAIETAEGMISNVLWHLLNDPASLERVATDRRLVPAAIEESLRLEPAAAFIDRYTTRSAQLGDVIIPEGELVTISLLASNRDREVFDDPDRYDIDRPNARQHVAFVQGPHGCLGVHLARLEAAVAVNAVLDCWPALTLDLQRSSAPTGLIFRKSHAVWVDTPTRAR